MKKVVVIGPESTGKSTLCHLLAKHYGSNWVKEYARGYLMVHGKSYTYDDLLSIAKGQITLEETTTAEAKDPVLFFDTNMYVMKVWCEFVFGKCHDWILEQIVTRKYDLYLLCQTDMPWIQDELREYPDLESRNKLYQIYKDIMLNQDVPWVEIKGSYEERLQTAISAVDQLL